MLTKTFTADQYRAALEAWSWLPVAGKTPVLANLFGDVFLQDGWGYWFLDSIEGSLHPLWRSQAEVQAVLDSPEGQDRYLLGGLAWAAEQQRGLTLADHEVYGVVPPPMLGGSLTPEHLIVIDFVVSSTVAGQVHQQVKDLPPGSEITGFTVGGT